MATTDPASITLLVAHGSRNPRVVADHTALCNAVAERTATTVLPAFLEISEPAIGEAIEDAVRSGAIRVTVLPLFVHVGNHVERDIPAIVAAARDRHPDLDLVLTGHIGAAPGFIELVATWIDDNGGRP